MSGRGTMDMLDWLTGGPCQEMKPVAFVQSCLVTASMLVSGHPVRLTSLMTTSVVLKIHAET